MERLLGPFFAVFIALLSGALVIFTVVGYALYGYCEDYCDKPPRSNWDAFTTMLPSWRRALVVAVVSCLAFGVAFWALVWLDQGVRDGTTAWLVGVPAVIVWEALTAVAARGLARRGSGAPTAG